MPPSFEAAWAWKCPDCAKAMSADGKLELYRLIKEHQAIHAAQVRAAKRGA